MQISSLNTQNCWLIMQIMLLHIQVTFLQIKYGQFEKSLHMLTPDVQGPNIFAYSCKLYMYAN